MDIQTIKQDDILFYCVKDICYNLDITNTTETLRRVDNRNILKKKIKRRKSTGIQETLFINIEGIKTILFRSKSSKVKNVIEFLELSIDIIFPKEEAHYISIIETSFDFYKSQKQYAIGKYFIDLYFPEFKLAIEVDENNHKMRSIELEKNREEFIIKELNCSIIRFNPTVPLFNIGSVISKIFKHIREYEISESI
jgi:very-short-patch-repair endonuclease